MSSVMKLLRRIGGTKAAPTSGDAGQLAVWKAGTNPTDAVSVFFHDGGQWVEVIDTALSALRNVVNTFTASQVIDVSDTNPALRVTQRGTGPALLVEDEAHPDASPFVITQSGLVGVGTAAPTAMFDVMTSGKFSVRGHTNNAAALDTSVTFNHIASSDPALRCAQVVISGNQYGDGGKYTFLGTYGNDHAELTNMAPGDIRIGTNALERMRIWYNGDVSINTQGRVGASLLNVQVDNMLNKNCIGLQNNSNNINGDFVVMQNSAGVVVGHIAQAAANTVAYVTSSDYRLKENIKPMTGALDKVKALNPVTYNWRSDGSHGQGFVAHELQSIVPECVTGEKDGEKEVPVYDEAGNQTGARREPSYQGIDTSFLVATIVKAMQEQQAQIETLEARLAKLEARP